MKKINRKKQIRNLSIIAFGCFLLLGGIGSIVRSLTKPKPEETVQTPQTRDVLSQEELAALHVDELGNVPIMMYHGLQDLNNADTPYTGGNIDVDGYQRTAEAFRNDLAFYYENGYRPIRLIDYIHGMIDTEAGRSPLILTFDDGLANNLNVLGLDENGEIEIDPNCAVGIMEAFKAEHPDMDLTATFFVNGGLFNQPEYNEKILTWLVEHGYDVGNHTQTHPDFLTIDAMSAQEEVGSVYAQLEEIIPGQYVPIVALPFGSPYSKDHDNMAMIYQGSYDGKPYKTESTLQVAWEADLSPFRTGFDPQFLKRIRAYDNGGENFDIQMNFDALKETRYISDGNIETIAFPASEHDELGDTYDLSVIPY